MKRYDTMIVQFVSCLETEKIIYQFSVNLQE